MKLFEPGTIGSLELKNRLVFAPIGIMGFAEADGSLSQKGIDYFVARAKGGVGLIITGAVRVGAEMDNDPSSKRVRADGVTNDGSWMRRLVEAVHPFGTKVAVQVCCGVGRPGSPKSKQGMGGPEAPSCALVAPSPVANFWDPSVTHRELTREEIKGYVEDFRRSAEVIRGAGIDAVDIHGHSGYLIDMFMTALWNQRSDEYGGDLSGRLKFPLDVVAAIKKGAGQDFPVFFRYGLTHYLPGGRTVEEGLAIARRFEAAGVDALDIDAGCYDTHYWVHPSTYSEPGCLLPLSAMAKQAVSIPVMIAGKLQYPAVAEAALQEGKADYVLLGKQLLADPEWPNKVKEGRWEDIRPCIGDFGCLASTRERGYNRCTLNPISGMETEIVLKPAQVKKSVLVVGGGPGGLEAARVAAVRGHRVTLMEQADELGGNLIPAAMPAFKKDYRLLIDYLATQVKKTGVAVALGKKVTPELIEELNPDAVVVVTGASPVVPNIPGAQGRNVIGAIDCLMGRGEIGTSVVVLGGGLVGTELALYLARQGKAVTVVARHDVCADMIWAARVHLLQLIDEANVKLFTYTCTLAIGDGGVRVADKDGIEAVLPAESVVLATGFEPNRVLFETLRESGRAVFAVGDCVQPRDVKGAIWEGFEAGSEI